MSAENQFHVRLGRILAPNGTGRFVSFAGRVRRAAQGASRSSGGRRKQQRSVSEPYFSRRVIVKVNLVKMGAYGKDAQRHHLNYIQRDSAAREGEKGLLYNRDDIFLESDEFYERGLGDRHQFRVIISPEDGREIGDLRSYTRNVMAQMERDLETKLDWVAANHYYTANPHSHIVIRGVRDTASVLIIPRDYISHGMREAAEHIATLELGPTTQIDVAKKLALSIRHDRFTSIDRDLLAKARSHIVDLSKLPLDGSDWSQRFEKWRVKYLSSMGLAEKIGFGRWRLEENLERTLRRMGERGDILKAYHRALASSKLERRLDREPVYDPLAKGATPVTGKVIERGVFDDVKDRSFLVLDTLQGEALFVETGREANLVEIERGMVVTAGPQTYEAKPSDFTIANIASQRGGVYGPSFHELKDPDASEDFIKAHVRRLEAMRRKGHAERNSDGSWDIPKDYLKRAVKYEKSRGYGNPVKLDIRSRLPLAELTKTMGRTWLDSELMRNAANDAFSGFGKEVEALKAQRHKFLLSQKLIGKASGVTRRTLEELEKRDMEAAGKALSKRIDKSYKAAPCSGRLSGIYREAIERPSGKYAVIEKSKEFTLVPWRSAMDRNLGKSISGAVRGQTISWTLTKARGQSIS